MHVKRKTKLATSFFPEKEPDRINNKWIHRILLEDELPSGTLVFKCHLQLRLMHKNRFNIYNFLLFWLDFNDHVIWCHHVITHVKQTLIVNNSLKLPYIRNEFGVRKELGNYVEGSNNALEPFHIPSQIFQCRSHQELDWRSHPAPPHLLIHLILTLKYHSLE